MFIFKFIHFFCSARLFIYALYCTTMSWWLRSTVGINLLWNVYKHVLWINNQFIYNLNIAQTVGLIIAQLYPAVKFHQTLGHCGDQTTRLNSSLIDNFLWSNWWKISENQDMETSKQIFTIKSRIQNLKIYIFLLQTQI